MSCKSKKRSAYLVSLGCPKNRVDSEVMLGELHRRGYAAARDAEDADVLVVNTCAFIGPAKEESVEAILQMARVKAAAGDKTLVVAGCLAQRYADELSTEMPEIDHLLGTAGAGKIGELLDAGPEAEPRRVLLPPLEGRYDSSTPRIRSTGGGQAYLKIAEGCDNTCSFCVIPSIRGPQRSRPIEDLASEAERLVEGGVREINLVAQDLTAYGHDLPSRPHLADLLSALVSIDGLVWIRMLYAYPRPMPDEFARVWMDNEKILPYLDMPLQHASDEVLRLMRRGPSHAFVKSQLEELRSLVGGAKGGLTLRTTFLVGHPGETQADFDRLREFVEEMRFESVGVFAYSDEEGTRAHELPNKVPSEVAELRRDELMSIQQRVSREHQEAMVGKTLQVLVEGFSEESELVLQGRHAGQAPEVDGVVYLEECDTGPGGMVEVEIHSAYEYDLVGRVVRELRGPARADDRPAPTGASEHFRVLP